MLYYGMRIACLAGELARITYFLIAFRVSPSDVCILIKNQKQKAMETIIHSTKVFYTGKTHTTGGREHGVSRSSDGHLDIKLSTPGTNGIGTNPEQLFAAGWSACFEGAMGLGARKMRIPIPENFAIDAEVDLCLENGEYFLQARLNVSLPGLDREVAQQLVDYGQQTCPYSKAISGNVAVEYNLV